MARIVVIGGSGHVGSYLLPSLVERGHEVLNVGRGKASPYREHAAWEFIENVAADRRAEEAEGRFGTRIADLKADIVVDMISFELKGAKQLAEALRGKIEHYLFCSSIWVYGYATTVPSVETDPTNAIDGYGVNTAKIERWLLQQARRDGFPATSFRPGHIVGEGWVHINRKRMRTLTFSLRWRAAKNLPCPTWGCKWCITSMLTMLRSGSSAQSSKGQGPSEKYSIPYQHAR
jgi:nucleoside-diphosphate-sugar epimerase